MEKNFHDNELDKAFRSAIEGMEIAPSDKFWKTAEMNIVQQTGMIIGQKASQWKKLSLLLIFLLGISTFYITYLNVKLKNSTLPSNDIQIIKTANRPNDKIQDKFNSASSPRLNNSLTVSAKQPRSVSVNTISRLQSENENSGNNQHQLRQNLSDFAANVPASNANAIIHSEHEVNPNVTPKEKFIDGNNNTTNYFSHASDLNDTTGSIESSAPLNPDSSSMAMRNAQTDSFPVQTVNQNKNVNVSGNVSRFFISGFFAPTSIKKKTANNDQSNNNNNESGDVTNGEAGDFSYESGLKFGIDLGAKWTLRTGLFYSCSSYQIKPKEIYATTTSSGLSRYSVVSSSGSVDFTSEDDTLNMQGESFQKLSYLSTPVQVSYNFGVNKFDFFVTAGLNGNFLIAGKTHLLLSNDIQQENQIDGNITGLRKFYFGYSAGFGLNYILAKHFLLLAEPFFSGSFQPINRNTPIKTYPFKFGIGAGLAYYF